MYFTECVTTFGTRYYGPFENLGLFKIWLEAHCPPNAPYGKCDNGASSHNHHALTLRDPAGKDNGAISMSYVPIELGD